MSDHQTDDEDGAALTDRLDSWKEIAAYLKRSVRTVTRWEQEEGLPVHRHVHAKSGTVYAFRREIDAWWASRGARIDPVPSPKPASDATPGVAGSGRGLWIAGGLAIVLALAIVAWFVVVRSCAPNDSTLVPLTTYPGVEGPPSLSPDGNQVTFERSGDIFVKQVDGEAVVQLTSTTVPEYAPAWSPDGRHIAFARADGVFTISPLGGAERKVAETRVPLLLKTVAWAPDARSLVVSEMTSATSASLFVISFDTGEKRRLTHPPEPSIGDGWPAVSPDGASVAFARYSQDTSANVYVVPLIGGEPRQLTSDKASIFGLAWASEAAIVFSSNRSGSFRLWRVPIDGASRPVALDVAGDDARFPSISRAGAGGRSRLAYQRFLENLDIRRIDVGGDGTPTETRAPSQVFIGSTRSEDHPSYSPDGTKIAFVSGRSGTQEIWVCASDASNPVRLTSMGGPIVIAPRWSPDARRLAFFATTGAAGSYAVYVTPADGGRPSRLTRSEHDLEALPAWSRDGRWIYFTSARSGSLQLWKMPATGGDPIQLTRHGGAEAAEAPDGRTVYYAKVPEMGSGLWSVPSSGGEEVRILDRVRFGYWAVARAGIFFIDFDVPSYAPRPLKFFDFATRQIAQVAEVENTVAWTNTPGFAVSPDDRWILYTSLENADADLMLVDRFR